MSDTPKFDFGKFVPGFDFLQNLAGSAGKGASNAVPHMPSMGSWVAPTMNVEDLDKRIDELKTVQFWLDQNAMALKATIQALEVQKMTLATLKGMNLSMAELASAFKFTSPASTTETPATDAAPKAATPTTPKPASAAQPASADEPAQPAVGVVDPMAWWGSLTQQFQSIAASALKDAAKQAAFDPANNPAVTLAKDALDPAKNPAVKLAKEAVSAATDMAKVATQTVTASAAKTVAAAKSVANIAPVKVPAAAKKSAPVVAKKAVKKSAK